VPLLPTLSHASPHVWTFHHAAPPSRPSLGELLEHMGRLGEAMQSYRRGHAYRRAIDLARREFPDQVGVRDRRNG
jgi:hypothetical protein